MYTNRSTVKSNHFSSLPKIHKFVMTCLNKLFTDMQYWCHKAGKNGATSLSAGV